MPTITSMNAKEIIPRSAIENGTSPAFPRISVAGTEPAPMNTRKPVPNASASQRWPTELDSMRVSCRGARTKPGRVDSTSQRDRDGPMAASSKCSTMSNDVSVKVGRMLPTCQWDVEENLGGQARVRRRGSRTGTRERGG